MRAAMLILGRAHVAMAVALGLIAGPVAAQSYSRTEVTTYEDNTTIWVLGQVKSVTCVASMPATASCDGAADINNPESDVISSTTFDTTYAMPVTTSSFGKVQATLGYDFASAVETGQRGTLKTVTDGREYTTTLTNWKRGIPQRVDFPDTSFRLASVDDNGLITAVTDENGFVTGYGYDLVGRLATILYPTGDVADAAGTPIAWADTTRSFVRNVADPYAIGTGHWIETVQTGQGRVTTYYNAFWQPIIVRTEDTGSASSVSFVVNRYDALGRKTFTSYPVGSLTSYGQTLTGVTTAYDALGRPTTVTQTTELPSPSVTTTAYLTGFQVQVTNPRNFVTTTSYQTFDQPSTDAPISITQPLSVATAIVRDPFGKPLSITRSGTYDGSGVSATRSYVYDVYQQLCKTINPESGSTVVEYDDAGNVSWSADGLALPSTVDCDRASPLIDADNTTSRTYDERNRVTLVQTPDGAANVATTYLADGAIGALTAANPGGYNVVTTYAYNKRRLLTSESQVNGQTTYTLTYGYNENGHRKAIGYPNTEVINYTVDALGRPTQVAAASGQVYASNVTYWPNGGINTFKYGPAAGTGPSHETTQNARKLPWLSRDYKGTTKIVHDTYTYDQNGNVKGIADGITGSPNSRVMTYDELDRLLTANGPWGAGNYEYDPLDNLRIANQGTRTYQYNYDAATNRLSTIKNAAGTPIHSFGYDSDGNTTLKNAQHFYFDGANRMSSAEVTTGVGSQVYRYDGLGRRVQITDPDTKESFWIYSREGQILYGLDYRRNQTIAYVYLNGSQIATSTKPVGSSTTTVKFQMTDALGSPVANTSTSGGSIARTAYTPWGEATPSVDGTGYTGHVMDSGTGLTYMQQRYYDGQSGRFLSVDSVAVRLIGDNFNRYWYAGNNPYKFTDPDGRDISCAGNRCTLAPIGGNLPTISFPRPEGFPAKINAQDSTFHHVYRFSDSAGKGDANYGQKVNNQLVQNPTPMENKPATLQGNKIDVNANNAISRMTGQDNVMSYKVPLPGGGNAVLNVTTGDHAATWGIVLRTTEAGPGGTQNIITYGEGDSALQRTFDPNNNQSREVWGKSAEDITRKAQQP